MHDIGTNPAPIRTRKSLYSRMGNPSTHSKLLPVFSIGCGTISVVIVLSCIALYMRSQIRYTVIGPTDLATGIRIEYTVSSRYIRKIDTEYKSKHRNHDAFTDWQYTPSSPSPFMQWLRKNILGSSDTALESESSSTITQTSSKHVKMAGWYVDSQGYVRVDLNHSPGTIIMASVASQEDRMVGDCPTTLVVEDSDLIADGHPNQY
jgi:hypothetical protein